MRHQNHAAAAVVTCLLLLAADGAAARQQLTHLATSSEGDPEFQVTVELLSTPWLVKQESGGIVYFLHPAPARIERYDLAGESWLADIVLAEAATAFWVDADGLYVSFGRRTSRFALDGTGEVHLRNTSVDVTALFTVGDFIYVYAPDDLLSASKWTGALIDQEEYWYSMQGFSVAPAVGKAFARTVDVGPSDIVEVVLSADGTLGLQSDSPYHGDYPDAEATWVFPDQTRVVDNSGVVYSTADLTYSGSLPGTFDDLDFDGDLPVVLRQGTLYSLSDTGLRTGQYTPANPPLGLAVHGDAVFSFYQGAADIEVEKILLTLLTLPAPGPPVDPNGLDYVPDALTLGNDGIVYLLSRENLSIFRWSTASKQYIETIPLVEAPSFMAYSAENQALYLAYDVGEITRIELGGAGDPADLPFVNSPQTPCGLATAGEYLFVCDPSGAWVSHFTYSPAGTLISQAEWNNISEEYVWSAANRKMYYFRDDQSPNDLLWEEIDAAGVIGAHIDSPAHSSEGIVHPIRIATDGSLVVLGSGRLYDAITLVQVDALSNDIDDGLWVEGVLFTLRAFGGASQIQKWDQPNWGVGATRLVDGDPIRLLLAGGKLLTVTLYDGKPRFTSMNTDLSMIFTDGFESGDVSAWSNAGGEYADLLATSGAAAAQGSFGLEAKVGASCTADLDLVITSPPATVEGLRFACNSVTAEDVQVGPAGATFAAGARIGLGDGFLAPSGPSFEAVLDPASASGLAFVEDDSPEQVACYNAEMAVNLDGLTLVDGDLVEHLVGYSADGEVLFRLLFLWNSALTENRLALEVRQDDGMVMTTLGSEEQVVPAGWVSLELSWRAGGGDGHLVVAVAGGPFVGLIDVDNALQTLDRIRWGNVGGVVTTSTGSLHLDDFESW